LIFCEASLDSLQEFVGIRHLPPPSLSFSSSAFSNPILLTCFS
jgi:hypothetical protein